MSNIEELEKVKQSLAKSKSWLKKLNTEVPKNELQELDHKNALETANLQIEYMTEMIEMIEKLEVE
jgi:hypothetical protein